LVLKDFKDILEFFLEFLVFFGIIAQRRQDANFKTYEEHFVHNFSCYIVFVE